MHCFLHPCNRWDFHYLLRYRPVGLSLSTSADRPNALPDKGRLYKNKMTAKINEMGGGLWQTQYFDINILVMALRRWQIEWRKTYITDHDVPSFFLFRMYSFGCGEGGEDYSHAVMTAQKSPYIRIVTNSEKLTRHNGLWQSRNWKENGRNSRDTYGMEGYVGHRAGEGLRVAGFARHELTWNAEHAAQPPDLSLSHLSPCPVTPSVGLVFTLLTAVT